MLTKPKYIAAKMAITAVTNPKRRIYPRRFRLSGIRQFDAVFEGRRRVRLGPLTVFWKDNSLPHSRLGISISRKVGSAPVRNRIKRLLRESFRLGQHDAPAGYDLVIVVHPHRPLELTEYQSHLSDMHKRLPPTKP